MDWMAWVIGGFGVLPILVLFVLPISHELLRRRFGYRCSRCRNRARFSGRSLRGFMAPECNSFTCASCGGVFWEVFGRLRSKYPGLTGLDD